jgi:hypothetical protein
VLLLGAVQELQVARILGEIRDDEVRALALGEVLPGLRPGRGEHHLVARLAEAYLEHPAALRVFVDQ